MEQAINNSRSGIQAGSTTPTKTYARTADDSDDESTVALEGGSFAGYGDTASEGSPNSDQTPGVIDISAESDDESFTMETTTSPTETVASPMAAVPSPMGQIPKSNFKTLEDYMEYRELNTGNTIIFHGPMEQPLHPTLATPEMIQHFRDNGWTCAFCKNEQEALYVAKLGSDDTPPPEYLTPASDAFSKPKIRMQSLIDLEMLD